MSREFPYSASLYIKPCSFVQVILFKVRPNTKIWICTGGRRRVPVFCFENLVFSETVLTQSKLHFLLNPPFVLQYFCAPIPNVMASHSLNEPKCIVRVVGAALVNSEC